MAEEDMTAWVERLAPVQDIILFTKWGRNALELIMAVSGHKSEKSFWRYIKADGMKKAFKIKEIWDKGPC